MPVPIWAASYLGLRHRDGGRDRSGLDAWGLVRLILRERFGDDLPLHVGYSLSAVVAREEQERDEIAFGNEELGDVIIFQDQGRPCHMGLVLGDHLMLHVEPDGIASIDRYDAPRWHGRIYGVFE